MSRKRLGPIPSWVGKRLRQLRLQRGLTQRALAGRRYSPGFISLVETGRSRMSLRTTAVLADRLGVPVSALIERAPRRASARQVLDHAWDLCNEMETYARNRRALIETALRELPGSPPSTESLLPPTRPRPHRRRAGSSVSPEPSQAPGL
jgi:transcriptional regulator with XRE-family HTH domain